jgi:hypothetical protein
MRSADRPHEAASEAVSTRKERSESMSKKLFSAFTFITVCMSAALVAPSASADDNENEDRRAGTTGHVTAYDTDNDVIDVDRSFARRWRPSYAARRAKARTSGFTKSEATR